MRRFTDLLYFAAGFTTVSDISAIADVSTMSHVNETVQNMTRLQEEQDPVDFLDMSLVKGDMFLDGCKVSFYVSVV